MMLELNGWDVNIRFSAAHFIPFHGKCSRLHGHDYAVKIRLYGKMTEQHMLMDFIQLKHVLRELVEALDHHVLIPKKSEYMNVQIMTDRIMVEFSEKKYTFPKADAAVIDINVTTAEALAEYLVDQVLAKNLIPANIFKIELGVDEGIGQGAVVTRILKEE